MRFLRAHRFFVHLTLQSPLPSQRFSQTTTAGSFVHGRRQHTHADRDRHGSMDGNEWKEMRDTRTDDRQKVCLLVLLLLLLVPFQSTTKTTTTTPPSPLYPRRDRPLDQCVGRPPRINRVALLSSDPNTLQNPRNWIPWISCIASRPLGAAALHNTSRWASAYIVVLLSLCLICADL